MKPWELRDKIVSQFLHYPKYAIRNELLNGEVIWKRDVDYAKYKKFPFLYRNVLPFEAVIDLDVNDKKQCKEIEELLETYDITYNKFFSGNRGWHYHIIYNPNLYFEAELLDNIYGILKDIQKVFRLIRQWLYDNLKDFDVDKTVLLQREHLILEICSWNKRKYIKYLDEGYGWEDDVQEFELKFFNPLANTDLLIELNKYSDNYSEQVVEKRVMSDKLKEKYFEIAKICLETLEDYKHKDHGYYITYHCPFHQPDRHPSFVVYKQLKHAGRVIADIPVYIDFHEDDRPRSMFTLYKKLKEAGLL